MDRFKSILIGGLGLAMMIWAIARFWDQSPEVNDKLLEAYSKRAPTAAEIKRRKSRPSLPQVPTDLPVARAPEVRESPTGDPQSDIAYFRNPNYRVQYDLYKHHFDIAMAQNRQAPSPPTLPWVLEEKKRNSVRWAPNPFGVEP